MRTALPTPLLELVSGTDDSDLAVRMRRRDPESAGILFDRYGKTAYNLALRILEDSDAAEAVVSEAMLQCWNSISDFRETRGCAVGVWFLLTTYSNAAEQRHGNEAGAQIAGAASQDWARGVDADHVQDIFRSIPDLNPQERTLLQLSFFEGLSLAKLPERMGLPPAEIEALIQATLGKLSFG